MPILVFKSVRSFTSEDPSFPASNLLSSTTSTGKKWKCQTPGESLIEVILELEYPATITAIDIGNEHSAFVEVFVSKSGSSEFKQILLVSSFMTPVESRNSDPVNRVRCFSKSALVSDAVESKWDLVKIKCTQPFNKQVQYGLSFIKLHSTDVKESSNSAKELTSMPQKLFGNFKIREDSPDSDGETSQSLFNRWKVSRNGGDGKGTPQSLSAAAAIRNASTPASLKNHSTQVNRTHVTPKRNDNRLNVSNQLDDDDAVNKLNRNRSELLYEDEDDKPNEKLDKIIQKEKERLEREKSERKQSEKKRSNKKDVEVKTSNDKDRAASSSKVVKNDSNKPSGSNRIDSPVTNKTKRQSSPISDVPPVKKLKETKKYKPFRKLLEGVVLVISGIQNPARATIRQQALDMGAKYKPDWEPTCTHLICAFKNTPKYNQVHGNGKIITKDWITECHKRKMRIPWRRFALDRDDANESESEDEIYDESLQPTETSSQRSNDNTSPKSKSSSSKTVKSPSKSSVVISDDDDSLDRYNLNSSQPERNHLISSGSDTEDEIRRVIEKTKPSTGDSIPRTASDDIYCATTEEEDCNAPSTESQSITPLPDFFSGKKFYLSQNVSSTDEIKLKRFISVYGGETTLKAIESDYILSNKPKATSSEFQGEVVKPLWVFECNELETLLPTQRYKVSG